VIFYLFYQEINRPFFSASHYSGFIEVNLTLYPLKFLKTVSKTDVNQGDSLTERQKVQFILQCSICCSAGVPPATIFCADKMSASPSSDFLPLRQFMNDRFPDYVELNIKIGMYQPVPHSNNTFPWN